MAFSYTPLRNNSQEIRVLTLEPVSSEQNPSKVRIRLRIETVPLRNAGEYTCLSYTWGNATPKIRVNLNGCNFYVRQNVHNALRRLQLPDRPRRLWIDAVCINQDDLSEREAQVAIMQHIYDGATEVIAWIGEDNGDQDQRAVDFIRQLSPRGYALASKDRPALDNETVTWIESVTPWGLVDSVWLDFTALIERPWFSRIWIVQEVVMGKKVTVWCGRHRIDWMDLFYCALFVREHGNLLREVAAPACLQYHDPAKNKFYTTEMPMFRLFTAVDSINCVGYLASRCGMHRIVHEIVRPVLENHWLFQTGNGPTPLIWGRFDVEKGLMALHVTRQYEVASEAKLGIRTTHESPNDGSGGTPTPNLGGLDTRGALAVINDTVPIYNSVAKSKGSVDSQWNMYDLVQKFRTFKATDPRDKVYALIGIAENVENAAGSLPTISYSPDVGIFDVFWDLVESELHHRGSLGFLDHACGISRPHGFPSWMPLWEDNTSAYPSTPCGLKNRQREPAVRYFADRSTRAVATMDKTTKTLTLAGVFCSPIEALGEMYDRDLPEHDQILTRLRWAGMADVRTLERLNQLLVWFKKEKRMSADEAKQRFSRFVQEREPLKGDLYKRFLGTLLASASDEGTEYLVNPPASAKEAVKIRVLDNRQTKSHRHATNEWEHHVEGRIADVCHGRRMFLCGEGQDANRRRTAASFGLCPKDAEVGDLVVLFTGADTLHVIRKVGEENGNAVFGLLGEAYVHDWMQGQLSPQGRTDNAVMQFRLR